MPRWPMAVKGVDVVFKIIRKETQSKTENIIKPECSHLESLTQSSAAASGKNKAPQFGKDTFVLWKQENSTKSGKRLQEANRDWQVIITHVRKT